MQNGVIPMSNRKETARRDAWTAGKTATNTNTDNAFGKRVL